MDDARRTSRHQPEVGSIRGTITAMLIAFACVLIFRAAVLEAFIIPTGSMAPTLLGRHVRLHSPVTGESWAVGATRERGPEDVRVTDPFTRLRVGADGATVGAGDRIFVFKPATFVGVPDRWSVIVFKNPENPGENFIKRLVGLPGEEVWLVDGDVFVRRASEREAAWRIARKPARVQDALWWTMWSSELAPDPAGLGEARWRSPWILTAPGDGRVVDTSGRAFTIDADSHVLEWNEAVHPVTDEVAYNDSPMLRGGRSFPTGDVRVRFTVKPATPGLESVAMLSAKSHDFRLEVGPERVRLAFRAHDATDPRWTVLADRSFGGLRERAWSSVSFAFVDQAIEARVNEKTVARHEFDWTGEERLALATGLDAEALARILSDERDTSLADPSLYRRSEARVRVEFRGAGATLARVGLDRDVSYSPAERAYGPLSGEMGLAGSPARAARLTESQLFALGDNAASSRDGRLWDRVDARVAALAGPDYGVVPLDLLVGRAFLVYFPAPHNVTIAGRRRPLAPDLGRVRMIR